MNRYRRMETVAMAENKGIVNLKSMQGLGWKGKLFSVAPVAAKKDPYKILIKTGKKFNMEMSFYCYCFL